MEDARENHKVEGQQIAHIHKGHLYKFIYDEAKKITRIQCALPKVEKYIKIYMAHLPYLRASLRKNMFPHFSLSNELFNKWGKYEEVLERQLNQGSLRGYFLVILRAWANHQ